MRRRAHLRDGAIAYGGSCGRSTSGAVGVLGPWPTAPWTSLGILPGRLCFDTLSLVLLFLRSARVDLMEKALPWPSTCIKSTVETDEPPLTILCMDGGGGVRRELAVDARCARSGE